MERRAAGKPYYKAISNYPRHKEEIDQLPRKCDAVLAQYPYRWGKYLSDEEDFFEDIIVRCMEAMHLSGKAFLKRVCRAIDRDIYERKQKVYRLYNPYRNLYLDKCYGEGKTTLVEWMDFSEYEE